MTDATQDNVAELGAHRRCQKCRRKLVKREYPAATIVNFTDGNLTMDPAPRGMVLWACPVCDLKGTA